MTNQPEALRLADALEQIGTNETEMIEASVELRRLHQSEREGWRYADELEQERQRLHALNQELLEALKAMEKRFGCTSSRAEDQPKTFGCHHTAETCIQCEGLVSGWKAVQSARAAIAKAEGEKQ